MKPVELTPSQVLRFASARGEYQRLVSVYAQPLADVEAAFNVLSGILGEIVKGSGQTVNGEAWDIEEDGECVRLVPKT
ncbi:MAG: hypothetical protein GY851_14665 [bacterium]|nr:hypothetical protein [bacterium]